MRGENIWGWKKRKKKAKKNKPKERKEKVEQKKEKGMELYKFYLIHQKLFNILKNNI
jgi:hypothetical protein